MIKKNTSQGNKSYHKTEVEPGTQTNFIHNNIYVKNDVFEAFYKDFLEYKGYDNDIFNPSIPKDDILHGIEKENITEHSKIDDLKKENEVLKEILKSKFDGNENNVSNNNKNDTWKTVKISRNNTVNNKVNNKRFNSIDVCNKY